MLRYRSAAASVGGHLNLPGVGQWVPDDGHHGVCRSSGKVFDDVGHGGPLVSLVTLE